jgi:hypothetical protein
MTKTLQERRQLAALICLTGCVWFTRPPGRLDHSTNGGSFLQNRLGGTS